MQAGQIHLLQDPGARLQHCEDEQICRARLTQIHEVDFEDPGLAKFSY